MVNQARAREKSYAKWDAGQRGTSWKEKLPALATMKTEYKRLTEEKKRLYEQYGEVKKDLKVYCVIKQNTAKVTNTGRACAEDV